MKECEYINTEFTLNDFNLDDIYKSGQVFRWVKLKGNEHYFIESGGYESEIYKTQDNTYILTNCSTDDFIDKWYDYFDIKTNYSKIKSSIPSSDSIMINSINFGKGIRILKQDLFETIVSFIISQNNTIHNIKSSINTFCDLYSDNKKFPTLTYFVDNGYELSGNLKIGYRKEYLELFIKYCIDNPTYLNNLASMNYIDALNSLKTFKGIGNKVGNCICLYALGFKEAFPIDTHIKHMLNLYYPNGFPYTNNIGILQQYLFYYSLH